MYHFFAGHGCKYLKSMDEHSVRSLSFFFMRFDILHTTKNLPEIAINTENGIKTIHSSGNKYQPIMTQPSIRLDSTIVPPSTTFNISYMDATVMDATAMDATAIDDTAIDATAMDATTIDATTIDATAIETTAIETPTMNTPTMNTPTIENKLKTSNNMPNSKAMGKRNPRRRNKPFCYDRLTVGDAKKEDLVIVKKHGTFRQTLLILNGPNKRYNVESAVIWCHLF